MLETTLATTFAPGSNLKGDVSGANWSFLLPSLDMKRIVCIGVPLPSTLTVLSRIGEAVLLVVRRARQLGQTGHSRTQCRHRNVLPVLADWDNRLPLARGGADLVFVADRAAAVKVKRAGPLLGKLCQLLGPEGLIYLEFTGRLRAHSRSYPQTTPVEPGDAGQLYTVTPWLGESQTAVPAADHETAAHFASHRLFGLACNPDTLVRPTAERVEPGETVSTDVHPRHSQKAAWPKSSTAIERSVRKVAQMFLYRSLRVLGNVEEYLARRRLLERIAPRYGMLIGSGTAHPDASPPRYLASLAKASGVDITNHRWGLCAKGEYSSRKVLFFLFARDERAPQYVVKMTREPRFNARLENEYRALSSLENCGLAGHDTLPRVAFFGHHGGIAIVGQTAINGEPFRKRTTWTADCPYARSAIHWLANLGASTADACATPVSQMAEALDSLLCRFVHIYRPTRHYHHFLRRQIERITDNRLPMPVVFQHGDPGTWNVMAANCGNAVFLDWEAAEQQGMPLWDLFYFIRSYCVSAARQRGVRDSLQGFSQNFLGESPLSALVVQATAEYCERCRLPADLVEPLFYTCWMHRALKEANRLDPANLATGHYVSLLRLCIDQRNVHTLGRLFSMVPESGPARSGLLPVQQAQHLK